MKNTANVTHGHTGPLTPGQYCLACDEEMAQAFAAEQVSQCLHQRADGVERCTLPAVSSGRCELHTPDE